MASKKTQGREGRGRQRAKRAKAANKKAEQLTADLIDHGLTKMLAHPMRVQILAVANQRVISPSEYAREFDAPLANVSYHFRKLHEYDCIELVERVPVRGSFENRYRGSRRGLVREADWVQLGEKVKAGVSMAAVQDFIGRCIQAQAGGTFDARSDSVFYWLGGMLDSQGWEKVIAGVRALIAEVTEAEVESARRMAGGGEDCIPMTFAVSAFESPPESKVKLRPELVRSPKRRRTTARVGKSDKGAKGDNDGESGQRKR